MNKIICKSCKQERPFVKGSILKKLRKEDGRTLKDIAFQSKISISYLADIENGRRTAPISLINFWEIRQRINDLYK